MKHIWRKNTGIAILFCLFCFSCLQTCQHANPKTHDKHPLNLQHRNIYKTNPTSSDIKLAQQLIEQGQFSQALPKLLSVLESGDNTNSANYYLGIVYQGLGSPQNALTHYIKYLQNEPKGIYAEHARKQIGELLGTTINHIEKIDTIENHIKNLEAKLQQDKENPELMLQLANWYWINQDYSKAGTLYKTLVTMKPELWNDPTITSRIEKTPTSEIVVLTPEEALKREAERNPIVFFNVTSFRSGRQSGWSNDFKHHIYNVSGQIRNRSTRTIKNVNIQLTIYGFSGMVYDTKNIFIGNLNPGQHKPFSAQFVNFDNIENIDHYDYTAYYDE
ncbi:MAG TPA: FxLYD domain-containing protein [Candidatus Hydrogenedens sp.]|nr:FxLYD domain-containing protein [Candidatus Hydrogenedens sp.]HOL18698.1 FxLYD domain-containing protein [Candidatus Hydrogenedens sp.]HPP58505.1 FxLYD domain-containing protein [Candidatus Hydrogenedens sp.]